MSRYTERWPRRSAQVVSCLLLGAGISAACGSDAGHRKLQGDGGEAGRGGESELSGSGTTGQLGGDAGTGTGPTAVGGDGNGGSATGDAGSTSNGNGGESSLSTAGEAATGGAGDGGAAATSGPLRALSVTAGYFVSLAVQVGTRQVWAWGYQVDALTGGYNTGSATGWAKKPVPVQGLSGVAEVVAVSELSAFYARHVDGTVSAWGSNDRGQLGDQSTTVRPLPVKVLDIDGTPMRGVCSIAAGPGVLFMARAPACSTYSAGSEPPDSIKGAWVVGQLYPSNIGGTHLGGDPNNGAIARQFPGLPASVEVDAMSTPDASASSDAGVVFLMNDGSRYAWGYNTSDLLGVGSSTPFAGDANTAVDVTTGWSSAVEAELGRGFAIARDAGLTLSGLGRNNEGQLGSGSMSATTTFGPVSSLTNVSDFSVGQVNVAAITNGQLWVWGDNGGTFVMTPTRLGALDGFTSVSLGDFHGLLIGPDRRVYVWGDRSYSALGDGASSGRAASPELLAE